MSRQRKHQRLLDSVLGGIRQVSLAQTGLPDEYVEIYDVGRLLDIPADLLCPMIECLRQRDLVCTCPLTLELYPFNWDCVSEDKKDFALFRNGRCEVFVRVCTPYKREGEYAGYRQGVGLE